MIRLGASFVGRTREMSAVRESFAKGVRLVTVWGPGGIGKTRLAAAIAPSVEPGANAVFCDLSEARDLAAVCGALGAALDVPLGSFANVSEALNGLGYALSAGAPRLIVLDMCDYVVPDAAHAVSSWMRMSPMTRFLATSREVLRGPEECVLELRGLTVPGEGADPRGAEAVLLLTEHIRAFRGGDGLDDGELSTAARLVQRLEGVPLAIELAAARLNVVSLDELLARVEARLGALDRDGCAAPRQRGLRSCFEVSWGLLSAAERAGLGQCAVFRGGFSIEAARAVMDTSGRGELSETDVLQSLVEKSLVRQVEPQARFDMYETVREYALQTMEPAAAAEARERHAAFFARTGERMGSRADAVRGSEARAWISRELANATAAIHQSRERGDLDRALTIVMALEPHYMRGGPRQALLELLDPLLGELGSRRARPELAVRALVASAALWLSLGRTDIVRERGEAAVSWAREAGDPGLESYAASAIAVAEVWAGRADQATKIETRARERFGAREPRPMSSEDAKTVANFGIVHYSLGNLEAARTHTAQALELAEQADNSRVMASAVVLLAQIAIREGRLDDARALLNRALELAVACGDCKRMELSHFHLGWIAFELEEGDEAERRAKAALALSERIGSRVVAIEALNLLGLLQHHAGHDDAALALYREAAETAAKASLEHAEGALAATMGIGALLASRDDPEGAARWFEIAEERIFRGISPSMTVTLPLYRVHLDLAAARRALADGDPDRATAMRRRCAALVDGHVASSDLERMALGLLRLVLQRDEQQIALLAHPVGVRSVVLARDGSWFRCRTKLVALAGRPQLARVLAALVQRRMDAPNERVAPPALVELAWPDERMNLAAGLARVHTSISRLRALGLRDALVREKSGYFLDPSCLVQDVDGPSSR
jgi:predicted ATPase